jgi:hypothetical protein
MQQSVDPKEVDRLLRLFSKCGQGHLVGITRLFLEQQDKCQREGVEPQRSDLSETPKTRELT